MDNLKINDDEIRIVGNNPHHNEPQEKKKENRWLYPIAAILLVCIAVFFLTLKRPHSDALENQSVINVKSDSKERTSYTIISDTIINNINLRCFTPVGAKPKLVVGLLKEIPQEYILGAMAADFGKYGNEYQVVGSFVINGEMLSHSKSKYGFCSIINDTLTIGNDLSTSLFEQAVENNGDFFRQYALVANGKPQNNPPIYKDALRRSLCILHDGRICVIDTDMEVSLNSFAAALCDFGVKDAISLMGSGAAVRWAVDKAGRRYIAGADEYEFPDVANYIVWE
ncbi:MAG: hypothetical protein IJ624_04125 [Prevotella sp.]|nr:hypothetical protein [Prevotella sp.]